VNGPSSVSSLAVYGATKVFDFGLYCCTLPPGGGRSLTCARKKTPRLRCAATLNRSSPGYSFRNSSEVCRRAAWREVERTMWDGTGLSGVGLPLESLIVVMVIGKGDGLDDGDKDAIRDERVSLDSTSEGKAASISGGRSPDI